MRRRLSNRRRLLTTHVHFAPLVLEAGVLLPVIPYYVTGTATGAVDGRR
jgi:hypothetical protein